MNQFELFIENENRKTWHLLDTPLDHFHQILWLEREHVILPRLRNNDEWT
jgi:hypothetical protein